MAMFNEPLKRGSESPRGIRYSGKLKGNLGDIGTCGKAPDDCYRRKSCMQHDSWMFRSTDSVGKNVDVFETGKIETAAY